MTPEQFKRVESLFDQARNLSRRSRRALIQAECPDDPTVRDKVEQMLARHDEASRTGAVWPTNQETRSVGADGSSSDRRSDPIEVPARTDQPWPEIPGYEIIRELHRGGQGVVYQAVQKSSKGSVAIKVLLERGNTSQRIRSAARKRFEREIELVAQLRHPNIITLFDSGITSDDRIYFVMDFVPGVTFCEYVRNERLPLDRILEVFRLACQAVQYAHERGVIHRDLKPSNILVDARGVVKVVDFGLAKSLAVPVESQVSVAGEPMGTFIYMSPEQTRGRPEELDARTDVYSLGVILYQLLTGRHPYPVDGAIRELFEHIAESPPVPLTQAWDADSGVRVTSQRDVNSCPLDAELETIVCTALAKESDRRYPNAGALADDIERYLRGEPLWAKPDSVFYQFRTRARRTVARNRAAALVVGALVAGLATSEVVGPMLSLHTNIDGAILSWFDRHVSPSYQGTALTHVRVIELGDTTDVESLARQEQLEGVSEADLLSLRRLHGRLMSKLALSRCKSVSWDIFFQSPSRFDADFVDGVRALKSAGVDVIARVPNWSLSEDGLSPICPQIAARVRPGSTICGCSDKSPWKLQLVAGKGHSEPMSSLVLETFEAFLHPSTNMWIALDPNEGTCDLSPSRSAGNTLGAKQGVGDSHRIQLAYITDAANEPWAYTPETGLKTGDLVGLFQLTMPSDGVLAASTVPYEKVISADTDQLVEWFEGKAVVIGNSRDGQDRQAHPYGRKILGTYALAVGIDSLLHGVSIRHPGFPARPIVYVLAATLGCAAAVSSPRGLIGLLAAPVLGLLLSLICAVAYRYGEYYLNVFELLLSAIFGLVIAAAVNRAYYQRRI